MDILKLSDGTTEIVKDTRDFSDLLDRKLGVEVRDWFDALVKDYNEVKLELEMISDGHDDLR